MDAAQFKDLVFCKKDQMYRFALRLLQNTAEAEDAVQQTMMKLWQKRDTLNAVENLNAFTMRSLQNHCLNALKKEEMVQRHLQEFGSRQPLILQAAEGNMVDIIKKEINNLPEKQRMIIQLADVEGFDTCEIAEIVQIDEGAVRTNLSRARQKIKLQLTKLKQYEARKI